MPLVRRASLVLCVVTGACGAPAPPPAAPAPARLAPATAPAPRVAPPTCSGIWLGTLPTGGKGLRLQLRLDLRPQPPRCALDSLDQQARGIPCTNVRVTGTSLSIDVPAVSAKLAGTLSADGHTLTATWTQRGTLPLVLTRQQVAIGPPKATLDPALPPVDLAHLKEVLDKDLAAALTKGDLAPGTDAGVVVGVVQRGQRLILTYGATRAEAIFEIGSISKTFTGLLLAQLVEQKRARLDEPVRTLLPQGTVAAPASGREITLLDLAAQRSGLPRMPDNFHPADPKNPYADYDAKALYAYLARLGLAGPEKPTYGYSNLGVGLLGQALANRAGLSYEALVRQQITGPLGMRDTRIGLTPAQRVRLAAGHDAAHQPARAWDLAALAGAGAIRSTARDMLTYLEAQLHPDRLPRTARATREGRTLAAAIAATHVLRGEAEGGMHIALNWHRVDASGNYWHNGGTGGHSAFALFSPDHDFAVVVLCNTAGGAHRFADDLGVHIVQRLLGKPAVGLGPRRP
jgi:serine-type D-Ala-D-Ala carboxypeptidase/endopeptidase